MNDTPKRRWLQFSLKWLIVAMLVLSIGMGLFARWWLTPFAERLHYPDGTVMQEVWRQRDWRGRQRIVKGAHFYRNGQMAIEYAPTSSVATTNNEMKGVKGWTPSGDLAPSVEAANGLFNDNLGAGVQLPPPKAYGKRTARPSQK